MTRDRSDDVTYRYQIREVATGEARICEHKSTRDAETNLNDYWWLEGNMSCDGNRKDDFMRANGEELDDEHECSDGKFVLDWVECDGVRFIENNRAIEGVSTP